jgi:hypothetical protein
MSTNGNRLSVSDVLLSGATSLSERLLAGLDVGEQSTEIKSALERAVPGLPLGSVIDGVCASLQQALDIPVSGLLVSAWDRSRELRAAIQQTRGQGNTAVLVPLLTHTITSEHRPYVDVELNGAPLARLVFPLKIAFTLDGFVLRIAGGRIAQATTGMLKIKATLKFADFVLLEKSLPAVSLPGTLAFDQQPLAA